jgi:hypothetical protein
MRFASILSVVSTTSKRINKAGDFYEGREFQGLEAQWLALSVFITPSNVHSREFQAHC